MGEFNLSLQGEGPSDFQLSSVQADIRGGPFYLLFAD